MFERTYRAEGISAGCLPVAPWLLDPAHELPGRLWPMTVLPPPRHSLLRGVVAAIGGLGSTIAASTGLMVLAQYLTTP
jgi:hypothetical protein